jgi:hypothetical protein
MLLSDRDLKAALAAGRMALSPYDEAMVQPSSIDVRLDRYFRVFANHRYTHIDPALQQDDLTEMVEVGDDESFLLHPGEFVLGSTLEVITLGDDLASRLEGKALALDTEVPTPRGWTTMEHLDVGDEVFDEQGRPTEVVATTERWPTGRASRCCSPMGAASSPTASTSGSPGPRQTGRRAAQGPAVRPRSWPLGSGRAASGTTTSTSPVRRSTPRATTSRPTRTPWAPRAGASRCRRCC